MCENLLLVLLYNKQFPTVNLVKVFSKTNHKGDHKRITAKKQTHDNVALLFTRSAYFIAYVNTNGELAESNRERTIELRSFTFSSVQFNRSRSAFSVQFSQQWACACVVDKWCGAHTASNVYFVIFVFFQVGAQLFCSCWNKWSAS